jgi:hypothetical protein
MPEFLYPGSQFINADFTGFQGVVESLQPPVQVGYLFDNVIEVFTLFHRNAIHLLVDQLDQFGKVL